MGNLLQASRQWAERPDDERYASLDELHAAASAMRGNSGTSAVINPKALSAVVDGGDVLLTGAKGQHARFNHWSFGQLCGLVSAPADYLRGLPADLAVANLNHGLQTREAGNVRPLFYANGAPLTLRAMTGPDYTRIWDADITERLRRLPEDGWRVPPARPARRNQAGTRVATADDVLHAGKHGLSISVGDLIAPAGLYLSDRDLFAFMVNESKPIDTPEGPKFRGFFAWNSEVGSKSFGYAGFLYDSVCGNHIVWGADMIAEVRVRHVGRAAKHALGTLAVELRAYGNLSPAEDERRIKAARLHVLGASKDAVLDAVFRMKLAGLTRPTIREGYELAERYESVHGNPRSAWGLASGLTRYSQTLPYADARVAVDRAAGKLLEVAF